MKKNILKNIFALSFGLLISVGAMAQGGNMQERAQQQVEQLKTELSLTDEQVARLKEINSKNAEEMRELRNNASGDRNQMMQQMRELRKNRDTEIRAMLTEEQAAKFDELQKEQKQGQQRQRRGRN